MATIREILLKNGFADAGICRVCNGTAWKYTKVVNAKICEVKSRILRNEQTQEVGKGTLRYGGMVAQITPAILEQVLTHHKLI
jgi:hypothetical protein